MSIFAAIEDPQAPPLTVDLLILPETSLLSLASVMEPLRGANRVAGRRLFEWRLWSVDGRAPESSSGLPIAVQGRFEPAAAGRAVIVLSSFNVDAYATPSVLGVLRRAARACSAARRTLTSCGTQTLL